MSELRELLAQHRNQRRDVYATLQDVPAEGMSAETTWGGGPVDVRFMFLRFADHEEEHELSVQTRLIEAGFQQTTAQRILARAEMTRGDLLGALVGLTDADLDLTPAGEWPLRRTLAHILFAERAYRVWTLHAVECFQAGREFTSPPEELRPPSMDEQLDGTLADFTERLDVARDEALATLPTISDEALSAPMTWFENSTDVRTRLMRIAHHEREHTAHILKWREQVGRPPTEAQRLLGLAWRARGVLEDHLVGVPDSVLDTAPEGEWPIRRLLTHLSDTDIFLRDCILNATPAR